MAAVKDGFWRAVMSPSCWVVLALSVGAAPYGMWVLAGDPEGDLGTVGWLVICPGAAVAAWSCLATLWRPDPHLGTLDFAALRCIVVPLVTAPVLGLVNLVCRYVPPVSRRIDEHSHADWYHPHYWFAQADVPLPLMVIGGGIVFAMLAGLAATAFLVWPICAIWLPDRMIRDSLLDTSPEQRATNVIAVRGYAAILPLTVLLAVLWLKAGNGTAPGWAAILVAGVLAVLVYVVRRRQRVDHARRAALGASAAIPNPHDPPPAED